MRSGRAEALFRARVVRIGAARRKIGLNKIAQGAQIKNGIPTGRGGLQLQTGKLRARIQYLNSIETLGIAAGVPNLYGLFMGDEQPAEPGTVGLV